MGKTGRSGSDYGPDAQEWNADEADDADERGEAALQRLTRVFAGHWCRVFPGVLPAFPRAACLSTMAIQDILGRSVFVRELRVVRVPCLDPARG